MSAQNFTRSQRIMHQRVRARIAEALATEQMIALVVEEGELLHGVLREPWPDSNGGTARTSCAAQVGTDGPVFALALLSLPLSWFPAGR